MPIARARRRDEPEIERWRVEVRPRLGVGAHRERRAPVFVDEAGFYLPPGRVRTDAPTGRPPIPHEWQTRDHLSAMGGVTPQGKVYVLVRQGSLNGPHAIEFLKHLIRPVGSRLLVIWDGSPIHRRVAVKESPEGIKGGRVRVARRPAYAPDLDPVEGVRQQLKHVETRDLVGLDLEGLHLRSHPALGRPRQKPRSVQSSFGGAGLTLEKLSPWRNAQ